MNAPRTILTLTALALVAPSSVDAQDRGQIEVSNKGVVKMFELRTTDGGELVPRRAFTQYLGMSASRSFDPDEGPHLSARVWLRLDTDLGLENAIAARLDHPDRQFVASDLQIAFVRVDELFGALDLILGRDLLIDPVSAQTLDGAQIRLDSPSGFFARAHVGMPVVAPRALTFDSAFGEPWVDVGAQSYKDELVTAGGGIGFTSERTRVQIAARRTASTSDRPELRIPVTLPIDNATNRALSDDRIGFALHSRALPGFELNADAVGDLSLDTLNRGSAEGLFHIGQGSLGARVEAFTPTFPLGSVFAVFGARPTSSASLLGGFHGESLTLDARAGTRAYGDPVQTGIPLPFRTRRGALESQVRARWQQHLGDRRWLSDFEINGGLRAEGGYGGLLLMGDAGGALQIIKKRLKARTRLIAFYAEPEQQPQYGGLSGGFQVAADSNIGERSSLSFGAEYTSTTAFVHALRVFALYSIDYELMD